MLGLDQAAFAEQFSSYNWTQLVSFFTEMKYGN